MSKMEDRLHRIADGELSTHLATESLDMPGNPLIDRYRCPGKFSDILFDQSISSDKGYFRFGSDAICYGSSCSGTAAARPDLPLYDVLNSVTTNDKKVILPFNLADVIDNLRLERYAGDLGTENSLKLLFKGLYYHFRPFLNASLRKQVQKFHARNWRKQIFPHWPVDTTVENILETVLLLCMQASGVTEVPFVWFWPKGAASCLVMTHDVETKTGRDFCENLMDLDDSFDIKAGFGIVPEDRYEVPPAFLHSIGSRGFEVTIQDLNHDGRLFDDHTEFLRRAQIINRYAVEYRAKGFRAGVLYRHPDWYNALEFAFDMSFPNVAPMDPQNGGCCTVFPFAIREILELPLTTTQDYSLFHVLNERSLDLWKAQIDLVLRKNGLLSFIVHPDYVMEPDTLLVYKNLLGYLRELRERVPIWTALPSEIDMWWRARSKMSLVQEGSSWRITGEGGERAVLAYAKNIDGKLVYELSRE